METSNYVTLPIRRGFLEIKEVFRFAIRHDLIICGGYARYCCSPKRNPIPSMDIDLFPRTKEGYETAKAELSNEESEFHLNIYKENDVSISYELPKRSSHIFYYSPALQLIKPMEKFSIVTSGDTYTILNNFDFTVTRVAIISNVQCIADEHFEADEKKTLLKFKNIHCPISSMFRAIKYIKKGYFLKPTEAFNLFNDWDNRSEEYRQKFRETMAKMKIHDETGEKTLNEEEIMEMEELMMLD